MRALLREPETALPFCEKRIRYDDTKHPDFILLDLILQKDISSPDSGYIRIRHNTDSLDFAVLAVASSRLLPKLLPLPNQAGLLGLLSKARLLEQSYQSRAGTSGGGALALGATCSMSLSRRKPKSVQQH